MPGVDMNGNCLDCGRKVAGTAGCPCFHPRLTLSVDAPEPGWCRKCGNRLACNIAMGDANHPNSGTYCPKCDVQHTFDGTLSDAQQLIPCLWADNEALREREATLSREVAELQIRARRQDEKIERLDGPRREMNVGLQACSVAAGTKAPLFRNIFDLAGYIRELRGALEAAETRATLADDDADKIDSHGAGLRAVLQSVRDTLLAEKGKKMTALIDLIDEALASRSADSLPDSEAG